MPRSEARRYQSRLRDEQADHTKKRILDSTRTLLAERGYAGTTIEALAQAAGVSAQTIYAVFRSKAGILAALLDDARFGTDYGLLIRQAQTTEDPAMRLGYAARIARQIYDSEHSTLDLLRGAGVLTPELARMEQDHETQRHKTMQGMIGFLQQSGALRGDLSAAAAQDVLWALTGRDIYRMLVQERHWTAQQYQDWLVQTLAAALLRPKSP